MIEYFDNDPGCMDMPCMCDCGNWFDLHDGYSQRSSNVLVCSACNDRNEAEKEIEDEIQDIELAMENGEMKRREGKKRIKELKEKLLKL